MPSLVLLLVVLLSAVMTANHATPINNIACLSTDYQPAISSNICGPSLSRSKGSCNTLIRQCRCQYNIELKWVSSDCPGGSKRDGVRIAFVVWFHVEILFRLLT